jgi:hypothetical protein
MVDWDKNPVSPLKGDERSEKQSGVGFVTMPLFFRGESRALGLWLASTMVRDVTCA